MRRMRLLCVAATIVASGGCSDTEGSGAAADTYPVAQKRLDAARTLQNAIKER